MFGFLKDKLKEAIGKFTKKAEEETIEEPVESKKEELHEEKEQSKKEVKKEHKPKDKPKEEYKEKKHEENKHKPKKEEKAKIHEEEPIAKPEILPEIEPKAQPEEPLKIEKVDLETEPEAVPFKLPKREPNVEPSSETYELTKEEQKLEPVISKHEEHKTKNLDYIEEDYVAEKKEEEKPKKSGGFFGFFKKKEKTESKQKEEDKAKKEEQEQIIELEKETDEIKEEQKELDLLKEAKTKEEPKEQEKHQDITEEKEATGVALEEEEEKEEKKGFFAKLTETVTKVSLSEKKFDELFWEIELTLLENNVAVEVIDKIKSDLKKELVDSKFPKRELEGRILKALKKSILSLFDTEKIDLIEKAKSKKPFVIVFIGINGTGKTTTLAKITHMFQKNNLKVVMGACDTFRAAAIQQLEEHANNLGVKIIKHNYGSDPAAVAFDTIEHAKAHGKDVVLIDTAGRLHSNKNLMQELEKVIKIAKPDLKIFIGESLAGNDVVEQVKLFNESVGIDGIILSKADTDEKGGAAISVSYITKRPILYLGTGQTYDDLEKFDSEKLVKQLGL